MSTPLGKPTFTPDASTPEEVEEQRRFYVMVSQVAADMLVNMGRFTEVDADDFMVKIEDAGKVGAEAWGAKG